MHAGDELQNIEQRTGYGEGVGANGRDLRELLADLDAIAIDASRCRSRAVEHANPLSGEDAGHKTTDHATEPVELEDIHALVDVQPLVDVLAQRTHDGRNEADERCDPDRDEAGCWSDADQACDGALAGSDDAEALTVLEVIDEHPAEDASARSGVCVERCVHSSERRVQSTAPVEAKPAEPDENRAQEDQGGIVGLAMGFVADVLALSEDEGIRQRRPAGSDMHGSTTCEIKRWEVEKPSIGVPCPACDGAVDDGRPEETEDQGRHDPTSLE